MCVYGRGSSQSFLSFVLKRLVQCVQREVGEGVVTLDTRSHIKRLRALSSGGGMGDTSDTLCIRHKVANMSTFADELRQLAEIVAPRNLFLVFDCAERIRFVDDSFFPSLLRLQEMAGSNVCVLLISDLPWTSFRHPLVARDPMEVYLAPYTKEELVELLVESAHSLQNCEEASDQLNEEQHYALARSLSLLLLDVLYHKTRKFPLYQRIFRDLFPKYCKPVVCGEVAVDDVGRLRKAVWEDLKCVGEDLQSASVLNMRTPLAPLHHPSCSNVPTASTAAASSAEGPPALGGLQRLPRRAQLLLVSGYLASHNDPKYDFQFFTVMKSRRRRKREHRQGEVDEVHHFPLERLLAIFSSVMESEFEEVAFLTDRGTMEILGTLLSLRFFTSTTPSGKPCPLSLCDSSIHLRCDLPATSLQALASSLDIDVSKYLAWSQNLDASSSTV